MNLAKYLPLIVMPIVAFFVIRHQKHEGAVYKATRLNVIVERVTAENSKGVYSATIWFDHGKSFRMGCAGDIDGVVTGDSVVKNSGSDTFYVYREHFLVGIFACGQNQGRKVALPENP
jgi:hypothetical protein